MTNQDLEKTAKQSFTLIDSSDSLFFDNAGDPVGKSSEFGLSRPLVIDELDFDRFHRGHSQDGFRHACTQPTQQPSNTT